MKKTAFIQAIVIFLLLVVSWFLLAKRLLQRDAPEPSDAQNIQPQSSEVDKPQDTQTPPQTNTDPPVDEPSIELPAFWNNWLESLNAATSPADMRAKISTLKESVFSLPRNQAVDTLSTFLKSGTDLSTGLAFQPGRDNQLVGAKSLRALIFDWLHSLDPILAGDWARQELHQFATALAPDVFVIHLRNAARDPSQSADTVKALLATNMDRLMNHEPWINQPTSAIAEAMDIFVYLGHSNAAPRLADLLTQKSPVLMRHAAALALERLVDQSSLDTLSQLLHSDSLAELPKSRANYFARLNPSTDSEKQLLMTYLFEVASPAEQINFLKAFPNLNHSLSHNLLSAQILDTQNIDFRQRLFNARKFLSGIIEQNHSTALAPTVQAGIQRIERQLGSD
jgi:hypothetical protein